MRSGKRGKKMTTEMSTETSTGEEIYQFLESARELALKTMDKDAIIDALENREGNKVIAEMGGTGIIDGIHIIIFRGILQDMESFKNDKEVDDFSDIVFPIICMPKELRQMINIHIKEQSFEYAGPACIEGFKND